MNDSGLKVDRNEELVFYVGTADSQVAGAEHLLITIPCPHHDYIDFLLLP